MNLAVAAVLAGGLALIGRELGWLTFAGAIAAAAVGAAVFVGGGLVGAALLGLFFVSGSLLTRLSHRKRGRYRLDEQSGGRRAAQVLANGSWAAIGGILLLGWECGWLILTGSLAAAQADTWATELGAFSRTPPRLLSSGKVVPPGTSGGITLVGTVGGTVGAVVMAALSGGLGLAPKIMIASLVGGVLGMMLDSLLGATLQASYSCQPCGRTGETPKHDCGEVATLTRGWVWLDNDGVNLVATGTGGGIALLLWYWM